MSRESKKKKFDTNPPEHRRDEQVERISINHVSDKSISSLAKQHVENRVESETNKPVIAMLRRKEKKMLKDANYLI